MNRLYLIGKGKYVQLGFTLLEQLFVITIIAVLTLSSLLVYQKYQVNQQIQQVGANVDRIMQVLQNYYFLHSDIPSGPIKFEQLKDSGWTETDNQALKAVPWAIIYDPRILVDEQTLLDVGVVLNPKTSPITAANLARQLHAFTAWGDGERVDWRQPPQQIISLKTDTGMWISNNSVAQFTKYMNKHAPIKPSTTSTH